MRRRYPCTWYGALSLLALALSTVPVARAEAWDLLRSENSNVRDGNKKLSKGDAKGALQSYDLAARQLPSRGDVQLDRGLALLRMKRLPEAREAFLRAAQPPASASVRADAYYDLGLAFTQEGENAGKAGKHDEARGFYQEAVDAYRRSLRQRPGDRATAWNLEIAARRITEEKAKAEQKKQQEQKQQAKNEPKPQNSDKNGSSQQSPPQKNDSQDPKSAPSEKQDPKQAQGQQSSDRAPGQKDPSPAKNDANASAHPNEAKPAEGAGAQDKQAVPADVGRVLDALRDSEENIERYRARVRAARDPRRVTKDW